MLPARCLSALLVVVFLACDARDETPPVDPSAPDGGLDGGTGLLDGGETPDSGEPDAGPVEVECGRPIVIDFGLAAVGRLQVRTLRVWNCAANQRFLGLESTGDAAFVLEGPTTRETGLPEWSLTDSEPLELTVRFLPTATGTFSAEVVAQLQIDFDRPVPTVVAHVSGRADVPRAQLCLVGASGVDEASCSDLAANPPKVPSLDFGAVTRGTTTTRTLRVRNLSDVPLEITNTLIARGLLGFSLPGGVVTGLVPAEGHRDIDVTFEPQFDGLVTTSLAVSTSDSAQAIVQLPLRGVGLAPATTSLCVEPAAGLDFGEIAVGFSSKRTLTLRNCGTAALQVTRLDFLEDDLATVEFVVQHTSTNGVPSLPLTLAVGAEHRLDVTYTPHAVHDSAAQDLAAFYVQSTSGSPIVRIAGRGRLRTCQDASPTARLRVRRGSTDVTANPVSETLRTVTVDATTSIFPRGSSETYEWRLIRQPSNGTAALRGSYASSKTLELALAGEYEVEVTAKDDFGCGSTATAVVTAFSPRVQILLTWPEYYGDADLHLVGPGGRFYDGGSGSTQSDCFHANCTPSDGIDWGLDNTTRPDRDASNDPLLLLNETWGRGPEIVNYTRPFDGTYKVVTHYYCSRLTNRDSSGPVNPVLKVFVDGVLQVEVTERLTQRDKWESAIITVSGNGTNVVAVPSTAPITKATGWREGCTDDMY